MARHDATPLLTRTAVQLIESLRGWWWMTFTERMPRILRRAELVLSEEPIRTLHPVPLHGRPDQVYALEQGRGALVVVDTKRRFDARVTVDMVIQLSVYATILRHSPLRGREGVEVASWGYIRFSRRGRTPRYVRVTLWPDRDVVTLYHQRRRLPPMRRTRPAPASQSAPSVFAARL